MAAETGQHPHLPLSPAFIHFFFGFLQSFALRLAFSNFVKDQGMGAKEPKARSLYCSGGLNRL